MFRSTAELLRRHHGDVPYAVVLDPKGKLYTELSSPPQSERLDKLFPNLT